MSEQLLGALYGVVGSGLLWAAQAAHSGRRARRGDLAALTERVASLEGTVAELARAVWHRLGVSP